MRRENRLALAIAAAFALFVLGWGPITSDGALLAVCALAAAAVVGVGVASRALRLGTGTALALQALTVFLCAAAVVTLPAGAPGLPGIRGVFDQGLRVIRTGTAPLDADLGVSLALVLLVATLAFLTDLLAIALQRPAYAAVPLLALFLVPALGLPGPVAFGHVIRFGVGVGLVLLAASAHHGDRRHGVRLAVWGAAAAVVGVALALTAVVGALVPVAATRPFGADQLQMTNPSLDLKRNLTQGAPTPVLTYTTDRPTGAYLKMATLTAFDTTGFALDAVRVSSGRLPQAPGLQQPGVPRTTRVEIASFASEWLPVPYAPTEVRAAGAWGYATETLDVMAMARPDRKTATVGLAYEVRSVDVRPTPEQVAAADSTALAGQTQYTSVPTQLPGRIRALARTLTASAPTAGARALALQAYLRSERFTYSTAEATGDSLRTLDDFLFGSRRGYCEQFAGAMVAMARVAGIPARVAVGFTPGTYADGRWSVSSRDMHAWPELWLDGWGWVAFEPTPASGVPTATYEPPATEPEPSVTTQATETPEPTLSDDVPTRDPNDPNEPDVTPAAPAGPDAGVLAGLAVALAVALLAAATPATLRARRRASRLAGGGAPREATLAAWDEVRDAAADLGVAWPSGSPRYAAEDLAAQLPPGAAEGLRQLAVAVERAAYDRPEAYVGPGSWGTTVRTVTDALSSRATRGKRLAAMWWPRSLWGR